MSFTVDQEFHDELAYATALLGEQVGTGDSPAVLKRALKALIRELEKTKFAATSRPRDGRKIGDPGHRYIPPAVKREVWARDGGQCTFVSESGQRCHARKDLEFDHMDAVALGGCAVAGRMRLLCRTHNQYEAERTFGAGFMLRKRADATAERRAARSLRRSTPEQGTKVIPDHVAEVVPWLRSLGFRAEEALNAAMRCESMADAALEDRIKAALARSNSTRPPVVAA
jgi:hypothetical protein